MQERISSDLTGQPEGPDASRRKGLKVKGYTVLTIIVLAGVNSAGSNAATAGSNDPNTTTTRTVEDRVTELEQKERIRERQLEIEREQAAEKAKTSPLVTANGKEGFSIKSPDGDFSLRLRGLLQVDSRSVDGREDPKASDDTFLLRRARPIFEGTVFKDIDFRFVPDFGEGKAAIQDAFLDFKYIPEAKLQVGRYKVPFGIERLQSNADTFFTELALSGNLTPNYDLGATLHGETLLGGKISYAAGVFNGAVDNGSADSDVDDKAFPTYADPAKCAQSARAWGVGLNWYWNRNVKWMLDYKHTTFQGGETGGRDREAENAILVRAQLAF